MHYNIYVVDGALDSPSITVIQVSEPIKKDQSPKPTISAYFLARAQAKLHKTNQDKEDTCERQNEGMENVFLCKVNYLFY